MTPLRRVGAGGDQENVMFLLPGVTVKLCGGPVGAGEEQRENSSKMLTLLEGKILSVCRYHQEFISWYFVYTGMYNVEFEE